MPHCCCLRAAFTAIFMASHPLASSMPRRSSENGSGSLSTGRITNIPPPPHRQHLPVLQPCRCGRRRRPLHGPNRLRHRSRQHAAADWTPTATATASEQPCSRPILSSCRGGRWSLGAHGGSARGNASSLEAECDPSVEPQVAEGCPDALSDGERALWWGSNHTILALCTFYVSYLQLHLSPSHLVPPHSLCRYFYTMLALCTFYAIFEDDVKRACLPPSFDLTLEVVIALITVFFTVDMGEQGTALGG